MSALRVPKGPRAYRITVAGRLDGSWEVWFDGFTLVTRADGTTALSGPVADQAQLHSVLAKVRDLGLDVISLEVIELS